MSRLATMSRFDESTQDAPVAAICAECDDEIYVGDNVVKTHDNEIIHRGCLEDYALTVLVSSRGEINADQTIN